MAHLGVLLSRLKTAGQVAVIQATYKCAQSVLFFCPLVCFHVLRTVQAFYILRRFNKEDVSQGGSTFSDDRLHVHRLHTRVNIWRLISQSLEGQAEDKRTKVCVKSSEKGFDQKRDEPNHIVQNVYNITLQSSSPLLWPYSTVLTIRPVLMRPIRRDYCTSPHMSTCPGRIWVDSATTVLGVQQTSTGGILSLLLFFHAGLYVAVPHFRGDTGSVQNWSRTWTYTLSYDPGRFFKCSGKRPVEGRLGRRFGLTVFYRWVWLHGSVSDVSIGLMIDRRYWNSDTSVTQMWHSSCNHLRGQYNVTEGNLGGSRSSPNRCLVRCFWGVQNFEMKWIEWILCGKRKGVR